MGEVHKTALPKVAVVGRPNVGKSTLFNRLVRKGSHSIVDKTPGVTRDRNYGRVEWLGYEFTLIDTGGFEVKTQDNDIASRVRRQAEVALKEGDVVLFIVDFKDGIIPSDLEIANYLRRSKKKIIPVVNKVDDPKLQEDMGACGFYGLGFEDPIPISALHGLGVDHLLDKVRNGISLAHVEELEEQIRVAIVGRPNVGKSSLLNKILGEERAIVDELPGTTRDSIDTLFYKDNLRYLFIDTAGIRKKGKVEEKLERFSVKRAIGSLHRAHVALLLIEAAFGVTKQDKRILRMMESSGCGGIIVANKWDLVTERSTKEYRTWILEQIPFLQYFPVAFTSALGGEGIEKLLGLLKRVNTSHTKEISTGSLNRVIIEILSRHRPPAYKGKELKIYYATQNGVRPPSFILFANYPEALVPSYLRYMEGELRENFDLLGAPIRFELRKRKRHPKVMKLHQEGRDA